MPAAPDQRDADREAAALPTPAGSAATGKPVQSQRCVSEMRA